MQNGEIIVSRQKIPLSRRKLPNGVNFFLYFCAKIIALLTKSYKIMTDMFLRSMKTLALAAALLATADATAANEIGQPVTEFTDAEWMKLDWPYKLEGGTRTLLRTPLVSFKINAPAAGKYAVEYLVNVTGNNVQLGAIASDSEVALIEPEFDAFAHSICKTDEELQEPVPADDETGEGSVAVELGNPVYMYSAVELKAGINYIHVFMHVYWRNDALAPQKVQFRSIRVLGEGSGAVGELAARASQKAFRVKYFTSLQDATTSAMVSDYEALLQAISTDYTKASTAAVEADMQAVELKEADVRHGKGVIVSQDSTRIDLLLYHNEYNDPATKAPLGGYDESGAYEMENGLEDTPTQLEFTQNNYFTYKFTASDDLPKEGAWYIQYLASSQNSGGIEMTILADDSATVVMQKYLLPTNNGAWQNYELMSNSEIAKFQMEAGKTYFLHMYYRQYTNVRNILVRYLPREYHTPEQLEALMEEAQAKLWIYREGTDEYYAVEDRRLLDQLQEAVDMAEEVVYEEIPEKVDEAYEKLNDAILALANLKVLNIFPTSDEFDVIAYSDSKNCSYKSDGGIMQLDNFRSGGYMLYKVYNRFDAEYEVEFEFAHANDGAQMEFQILVDDEEAGARLVVTDALSEEFTSTGGWQTFEPKSMKVGAVPAGYVYLKITGTGPSYVGNPRLFKFTKIDGTEGAGAKAVEDARKAWYAQFTPESVQEKADEAQAAIDEYGAGSRYENRIADRTPIEKVEEAIRLAKEAIASGDSKQLQAAYDSLTVSTSGLKNLFIINVIPSTDEDPFNLAQGTFDQWRTEGAGNIGFGYEGGSVTYNVFVAQTNAYDMTLRLSNAAPGGVMRVTITEGETVVTDDTVDVPGNGWGAQEDVVLRGISLKEGRVTVKIFGETAAGSWVGNIYAISFTIADPTGIDEAQRTMNDAPAIYNLQGCKVNAVKKGLYIINGKKAIVK